MTITKENMEARLRATVDVAHVAADYLTDGTTAIALAEAMAKTVVDTNTKSYWRNLASTATPIGGSVDAGSFRYKVAKKNVGRIDVTAKGSVATSSPEFREVSLLINEYKQSFARVLRTKELSRYGIDSFAAFIAQDLKDSEKALDRYFFTTAYADATAVSEDFTTGADLYARIVEETDLLLDGDATDTEKSEFDASEIVIILPHTSVSLLNQANLNGGAGSTGQYADFFNGLAPSGVINGVRYIAVEGNVLPTGLNFMVMTIGDFGSVGQYGDITPFMGTVSTLNRDEIAIYNTEEYGSVVLNPGTVAASIKTVAE